MDGVDYKNFFLIVAAYWIAHRAIKLVYDCDDGIERLPEGMSINILQSEVVKFFNVRYNN